MNEKERLAKSWAIYHTRDAYENSIKENWWQMESDLKAALKHIKKRNKENAKATKGLAKPGKKENKDG